MIYLLLSLIGLPSGWFITHLTIDECKGKNKLIAMLIIPFIILLFFNLGWLVNTLFLFIIFHLVGSLIYLRCRS
ncbi:MAG: hypothetical protein WC307_02600 [Candidatus Nanoarchaeia archaeon]|jgi:hypothetical protein